MFELLMLIGFAYAGFCHLPNPVKRAPKAQGKKTDAGKTHRRSLPHGQPGRHLKHDSPQVLHRRASLGSPGDPGKGA
ncbi:hypothetical protein DESUT3_16700 [Desulfuromonas versatilis]|uniref:Uncharacterized protein n=1 Tax=Desulfuromonas versatilis TaxID=2802975 RepID=A0ABM8HV60_9BACT|nr:hypothetical protein [Desulfuromonas versatilis]BCR04601.1 hypothetical protein DESUT3_16700 [Desulfuromonas versatilis]